MVAKIVDQYGINHNAIFAVGKNNGLSYPLSKSIYRYHELIQLPHWLGFDMMNNHLQYNREKQLAVTPNATFIATLREPVNHFESAFAFFKIPDKLPKTVNSTENPLKNFFRLQHDVQTKLFKGNHMRAYFGMPKMNVHDVIKKIEDKFGLILITDYLDESLILMKNLLCWDLDDMLYISSHVRKASYRIPISPSLARKIERYNSEDKQLYDHFNKTLWEKVAQGGRQFQDDLKAFRLKKDEVTRNCVAGIKQGKGNGLMMMERLISSSSSEQCKRLLSREKDFINIKRQMIDDLLSHQST